MSTHPAEAPGTTTRIPVRRSLQTRSPSGAWEGAGAGTAAGTTRGVWRQNRSEAKETSSIWSCPQRAAGSRVVAAQAQHNTDVTASTRYPIPKAVWYTAQHNQTQCSKPEGAARLQLRVGFPLQGCWADLQGLLTVHHSLGPPDVPRGQPSHNPHTRTHTRTRTHAHTHTHTHTHHRKRKTTRQL